MKTSAQVLTPQNSTIANTATNNAATLVSNNPAVSTTNPTPTTNLTTTNNPTTTTITTLTNTGVVVPTMKEKVDAALAEIMAQSDSDQMTSDSITQAIFKYNVLSAVSDGTTKSRKRSAANSVCISIKCFFHQLFVYNYPL